MLASKVIELRRCQRLRSLARRRGCLAEIALEARGCNHRCRGISMYDEFVPHTRREEGELEHKEVQDSCDSLGSVDRRPVGLPVTVTPVSAASTALAW